jgi:hypothetical protein
VPPPDEWDGSVSEGKAEPLPARNNPGPG